MTGRNQKVIIDVVTKQVNIYPSGSKVDTNTNIIITVAILGAIIRLLMYFMERKRNYKKQEGVKCRLKVI
jgi:hypothetical protein